jgi:hypothetical protein
MPSLFLKRNLRLKEVVRLPQGHMAYEGQSGIVDLGLSGARASSSFFCSLQMESSYSY